jgi:hypothetical protein
MNQRDDELTTDMKRLARSIRPVPITTNGGEATPPPPPGQQPLIEQKDHDLLHRSLDQIANNWVKQLQAVRTNAEQIEQLVLTRAAKVKADITQLYLLGTAAVSEAERSAKVCKTLQSELEQLGEVPDVTAS